MSKSKNKKQNLKESSTPTEPAENTSLEDRLEELRRVRMIDTARSSFFTPKRIALSVLIVIFLAASLFLVFVVGSNHGASSVADSQAAQASASPSVSAVKVVDSVTGKSPDEDKKDAMNAAKDLLNASRTTEGSSADRLQRLDNNDFSSITKDMTDRIDFQGSFANDRDLQKVVYQSLIALDDTLLGNQEVKLNPSNAWEAVEVDSEKGIAWVPVGGFANKDVPFSMEMVYKDGQWKFAPYSFVESVKMSSMISEANSDTSSTK